MVGLIRNAGSLKRVGTNTTHVSLLERLRQPDEQQAWERFVELYTPLLYYWARRVGLQPQDAADLVQDVFTVLVQKLPEFNYDRNKSFRGWLRTVTMNKWRENSRRHCLPAAGAHEESVSDLADLDGLVSVWESEYRDQLVRRALEVMKTDFQPATWKACWEHVACGRTEGILLDPVYTAKAMAALIADLRGRRLRPDETAVFVHTGGQPAVFAYRDEIARFATFR